MFPSFCRLSLLAALCALPGAAVQGEPVITEFLASNGNGLTDEEGEQADWIEIYNDTGTVSLEGWHLTDAKGDRTRWALPAVTMGPRQTLLVFASGKNRTVPGVPLHTNFKLSAEGGYLALIRPDRTVATEFDPYPAQFTDRSYGMAQTVARTDFIGPGAPVKWTVPAGGTVPGGWAARDFNDAAWSTGVSGLAYEPVFAGFLVKAVQANVPVTSLAAAETVLTTPAQQAHAFAENRQVIDYWNTGTQGNYANNFQPPGMNGTDIDHMVIVCTGTVTIPSAGPWTFAVNSNDGFGLTVGGFSSSLPMTTDGTVDTLKTFNFPAAGAYPVRLVYFSATGGAGVELFAAPGTHTSFNAGVFTLLGNTAAGGLTVTAPPAGGTTLAPYTGTNTGTAMRQVSPSLYARFPFSVAAPQGIDSLTLPVRYDDGFAVFLNGTEVLRRNAPAGLLTPASVATTARSATEAVQPEHLDLTPWTGLLTPGVNVLAFQGLNVAAGDTDFLLQPELARIAVTPGQRQYFVAPSPGTFNTGPAYNRVAPVTASAARGFYDAPFSLTLSTGTEGAQIRYTYDGSAPVPTSALWTGPVTISRTTTVRAAAFKAGSDPSPVFTGTYLFTADIIDQGAAPPVITNPPGSPAATTTWPSSPVNGQRLDYGMDPRVTHSAPWQATIANDLKSVPVISVVTDLPHLFSPATGVYVNAVRNGDVWERPCSIELIHPDGSAEGFQQDCGIRIRGNFSRDGNNPKHSLRFFFRGEYGSGKLHYPFFGEDGPPEHDVIDLRTAQDYSWAFLGSGDANFIADLLSRDLMGSMGLPSTRGFFCHVYLNGQYWGLYDTEERINPSFCVQHLGGREEDWDVIKTNDLHIETASGTDSDYSLLWQKTEAAGIATVAGYMELQGLNPDGTRNPAFKPLLDPVAITDYMLMNYIIDNVDGPIFIAGRAVNNYFAVRPRNSGLPWAFLAHDSELSLVSLNEDITGNYGVGAVYSHANPRRFMERCLLNPEYRILFADRVQKHFFNGGALTPERTGAAFAARRSEVDRAIVGESARWGDSVTPYLLSRDEQWLQRVDYLQNTWFPQRTGIVLNQLRARGYFPGVSAPVFSPQRGGSLPSGTAVTLQNSNPSGALYYTTDGTDPRAIGGGLSPSARLYSTPLPVAGSMRIRARVLQGSTWSPLDEAAFFPSQSFSGLALTEIHYHPLPEGSLSPDDLEFVEFKNTGSTTLDAGGCNFTTGISFTFPAGFKLAPGAFAALVRNPEAFAVRYPGVPVAGVFTGKLDNGGEPLALADATGAEFLRVRYDDDLPWPVAADAHGFSLVRAPGTATGWRASTARHGSPGADDPPPNIPPVVVNEVLSSPPDAEPDVVELYNPGAAPVTIGGWWLSDDPAAPKKFRIPAGTVIAAGGYVTFDDNDFNADPSSPGAFSFGADGDQCVLMPADTAGNLTGYSHGFDFKAAEKGVSFGRYVNSAGAESFPAQTARSLNAVNPGPRLGPVVLNEVHYHPAEGGDAFIEIHNRSQAEVPLYLSDPANVWRLAGDADFLFPAGSILPAGGFIVITPLAAEVFRTKYAVPAGTTVLGGWSGMLPANEGRVSLERPQGPLPDVHYIVEDALTYCSVAPWPEAAAGTGPSLQRRAHSYADEPLSWFAGGLTPGRANGANLLPVVTLTQPADGSTYMLPATVTLAAAPSDPEGELSRVDFLADGALIGQAFAAPWTFAWQAGAGVHTVAARAYDITGAASEPAAATVLVNPAPGAISQTLISSGSVWKYRDTGGDPGATWAGVDFNDTAWPSGPAQLGYGDGDEATRVEDNAAPGYDPADTDRFLTTHFRHRFNLTSASSVSGLTLRVLRDDGAAVYLNGQPVWTDNLPEPPAWDTPATLALSDPEESQFVTVTLPASALTHLRNGGNVLAAEVHQQSPESSDISFDLELTATQTTPPPVITVNPQALTVVEGQPAVFTAAASGTGVTWQWHKDGVPVTGAAGRTLTLQPATAGDAGAYRAVAVNQAGAAITTAAALTVLPAASTLFTAQPDASGKVTIRFTADASLTYEVRTSADMVNWSVLTTIGSLSGPVTLTHALPAGTRRGFYSLRVMRP